MYRYIGLGTKSVRSQTIMQAGVRVVCRPHDMSAVSEALQCSNVPPSPRTPTSGVSQLQVSLDSRNLIGVSEQAIGKSVQEALLDCRVRRSRSMDRHCPWRNLVMFATAKCSHTTCYILYSIYL